jgi:hypothetical protein
MLAAVAEDLPHRGAAHVLLHRIMASFAAMHHDLAFVEPTD